MKSIWLTSSLSVLALASATAAAAQAVPDPSQTSGAAAQSGSPVTPDAASPQAVPSSAADNAGIGDIVVTAQRRSENLQNTALPVSAVDGSALQRAGISQAQDLTKLIPALQLSSIGAGGTQVTIRGVGNFAPFLYSEPAVAINYDGVYLARSAAPNGLFFDLERVEVLKGPQGTLYGRNATGGAVNVISVKPRLNTTEGNLFGEIGNYALKRLSGAINLPLGDKLAFRVAGQVVDRNGYLTDGYSDDVGQAVRGQLLFVPVDTVHILLDADYIHQGGKGPGSVFALSPTGYIDPSNPYLGPTAPASNAILRGASLGISGGQNPNLIPPFGSDGFINLNEYGFSSTIDVDLGGAALTIIPAYRHTRNDYKHYAGGFPVTSTEDSNQETLEARLASKGAGKLKWVVGGYYFHDNSTLFAAADQGITRSTTISPGLPVRSLAAFGQATYSLTDHFRVTGGLRYTNERKTQTGTNIGSLPPVPAGFPAPPFVFYNIVCPAPGVIDVPNNNCTAPFSGAVEYNRVTWKAGVEADVAEHSLVYASAETGFKAGGFYPSLAPNTYAPERIFAVTLGSKNRFLDNKLQVNVEAFYWKYKDKQVSHLGPIRPSGYTIITENAGAATLYGAEVDVIWKPTPTDRFGANIQYEHSRYDSFGYTVPILSADPNARAAVACPAPISVDPRSGSRSAAVDCAGYSLPQTPNWVGTFSYQHDVLLAHGNRVEGLVGTKLQSSYYTGEEYLPGQYQRRSMVSYADLTFRADANRFSIGAFVDNIEDTAVKSSSFIQPVVGIPVVVLRSPRTYGVRAGVRF